MVTDESRSLTLQDIAGLPIGHVPRGLALAFRDIIDTDGEISAIPTGAPVPSFFPWPEPKQIGGGVVIPCNYNIKHGNLEYVRDVIGGALLLMPEGTAMLLN